MSAGTQAGGAMLRVSTAAVEARHRASLIGDMLGQQLAGAEVTAVPDGTVACDWSVAALDRGTALAFGRQAHIDAARRGSRLHDDDADFSLFMIGSGSVRFDQNDRRTLLEQDKALLVAHGRAVASQWQDSDFTVLRLPRQALGWLPGVDAAGGLAIDLARPAMRLLLAYIDALRPMLAAGSPPPVAARHLAELAAVVVAEALGTDRSVERGGGAVEAGRIAAMRQVMSARLGDARLTMSIVAAAAGVSERTGYLLWKRTGERFSDTLYAMRLDRARERLLAGYSGRLLDLALAVGFAELSHFNHRFRQRFGHAPGDLRRRPAR